MLCLSHRSRPDALERQADRAVSWPLVDNDAASASIFVAWRILMDAVACLADRKVPLAQHLAGWGN